MVDSTHYDRAFCELALAIIRATVGREMEVRCNLPRWMSVSQAHQAVELERWGQDGLRCRLMPSNREDEPTPIDIDLPAESAVTVRMMGGGVYSIDAAIQKLLGLLTT